MTKGNAILGLGVNQKVPQDLSATQEGARAKKGRLKEKDSRGKEEILALVTGNSTDQIVKTTQEEVTAGTKGVLYVFQDVSFVGVLTIKDKIVLDSTIMMGQDVDIVPIDTKRTNVPFM